MGLITDSASVEIDAPIDTVWAEVEDVLSAPQWQDGMDSMTLIESDGQGRPGLVETRTDAKVTKVASKVRFDWSGAPRTLRWAQTKGDLKSVKGAWVLEDLGGDRTKATYELEIDPGRMLGMLVRGPAEAKLRKLLVHGRPGELKARVESK